MTFSLALLVRPLALLAALFLLALFRKAIYRAIPDCRVKRLLLFRVDHAGYGQVWGEGVNTASDRIGEAGPASEGECERVLTRPRIEGRRSKDSSGPA